MCLELGGSGPCPRPGGPGQPGLGRVLFKGVQAPQASLCCTNSGMYELRWPTECEYPEEWGAERLLEKFPAFVFVLGLMLTKKLFWEISFMRIPFLLSLISTSAPERNRPAHHPPFLLGESVTRCGPWGWALPGASPGPTAALGQSTWSEGPEDGVAPRRHAVHGIQNPLLLTTSSWSRDSFTGRTCIILQQCKIQPQADVPAESCWITLVSCFQAFPLIFFHCLFIHSVVYQYSVQTNGHRNHEV